jgi:diguanylate cyclase
VLRGVALVIRSGMRADSHAGRLAGDRFVVAMPATLAQTELAANRIRAAVETLHFPNFPRLHCAISIGLAEAPKGDLGLDEWIEEAGRALLRARAEPRNRTVVYGPRCSIQPSESPLRGELR